MHVMQNVFEQKTNAYKIHTVKISCAVYANISAIANCCPTRICTFMFLKRMICSGIIVNKFYGESLS